MKSSPQARLKTVATKVSGRHAAPSSLLNKLSAAVGTGGKHNGRLDGEQFPHPPPHVCVDTLLLPRQSRPNEPEKKYQ
jgi:hypothetical protein